MKIKPWPALPHGAAFPPEQEQLHMELAVMGRRRVSIYVAPDRHMYHPNPGPLDFSNEFCIEHWGPVVVSRMCQLTHVDPQLIQDIYTCYRADECLNPNTPERIMRMIRRERRQLITDLFPFNELAWWREMPHPNPKIRKQMVELGPPMLNRDIVHNLPSIKDRCLVGKHAIQRQSRTSSPRLRAVAC